MTAHDRDVRLLGRNEQRGDTGAVREVLVSVARDFATKTEIKDMLS